MSRHLSFHFCFGATPCNDYQVASGAQGTDPMQLLLLDIKLIKISDLYLQS